MTQLHYDNYQQDRRATLLAETVDFCVTEALKMQGQYHSYKNEKDSVYHTVVEAKNWLEKQPSYLTFLQQLQTLLQQQNIGAFSELLSYFVQDVLKKEKEIVFDLYTFRNLPALKIEALNDGNREDLFDGNGGSIVNIVSTGLRLIALSRLEHRQFIVLDEPDCWLKPDSIPIFAKIIGDISSKLNIQTIIISHHNWSFFKDYSRVIELSNDGGLLNATIIHDTPVATIPDNYIQSVQLKQFMSHYNTTFQLHPHLTCVIGEHDIGKSVLGTALRAVAYNESSDSFIMHGEEYASIAISLSTGEDIWWQRVRKTNQEQPQKVKYSLFRDNIEVATEYNANDTPVFISKTLNICTAEDIDVHISHQKQPVFLLSNDIKPAQRAKILSLGKESLIIQKMMENIRLKTRSNKQTIREGEVAYAKYHSMIEALNGIDEITEQSRTIQKEINLTLSNISKFKSLHLVLNDINEVQTIASINPISPFEHIDTIHNLNDIKLIIQNMHLYQPICGVTHINIQAQNKELHPTTALATIIQSLNNTKEIISTKSISLPNLEDLPFTSTSAIQKAIPLIKKVIQAAAIEHININSVIPTLIPTGDILSTIKLLQDTKAVNSVKPVIIPTEQYSIQDSKPIAQTIHLIKQSDQQIETLLKQKKENENQLKEFQLLMDVYFNEFGQDCPTCGQSINQEHLLQGS